MRDQITVNRVLVFLAIICFVLAAFGMGSAGPVGLVPLGLALWAAANLL